MDLTLTWTICIFVLIFAVVVATVFFYQIAYVVRGFYHSLPVFELLQQFLLLPLMKFLGSCQQHICFLCLADISSAKAYEPLVVTSR